MENLHFCGKYIFLWKIYIFVENVYFRDRALTGESLGDNSTYNSTWKIPARKDWHFGSRFLKVTGAMCLRNAVTEDQSKTRVIWGLATLWGGGGLLGKIQEQFRVVQKKTFF